VGVAEAVAERVRRYILDGTDQDLRRLLSISQAAAEMAHAAFCRVGVQQGWHAIDCGCGPIGGLAGGWLVAQEPLRTPAPRSHPDLAALARYWELLHALLERAGVPAGAVEDLPQSARQAGFEVAGMSGYFMIHDPELGFELHASTLAAARERALRAGVATEQQIDELVGSLRAAKGGEHAWVSSPFFLDLKLRKPMMA
jgi:hypothetical protein